MEKCDKDFVVRVSGKLCIADSLQCSSCGLASMGLKPPALGRFNWIRTDKGVNGIHLQCTGCKCEAKNGEFYNCSEWFGVGTPTKERWPFRKRMLQYLRDDGVDFDQPYKLFAGSDKKYDLRQKEKRIYEHDHPIRTNWLVQLIFGKEQSDGSNRNEEN